MLFSIALWVLLFIFLCKLLHQQAVDFAHGELAFELEWYMAGGGADPGIHVVAGFGSVFGGEGECNVVGVDFLLIDFYFFDSGVSY